MYYVLCRHLNLRYVCIAISNSIFRIKCLVVFKALIYNAKRVLLCIKKRGVNYTLESSTNVSLQPSTNPFLSTRKYIVLIAPSGNSTRQCERKMKYDNSSRKGLPLKTDKRRRIFELCLEGVGLGR